jgi:hypothetical protein
MAKNIHVFHSAHALFCAPSNQSGIGGMFSEMIRSTPMWKKGEICAPRRDCIYVAKRDYQVQNGFRDLLVARVRLFFSFRIRATSYQCALVHWFYPIRDAPDPDTGMWMVQPARDPRGYRKSSVIHMDSVLRSAHLLPAFGQTFVERSVMYTKTLNIYDAFYVNKYIDHHAFEIAF